MQNISRLADKPPTYFDAMNIPIDDYPRIKSTHLPSGILKQAEFTTGQSLVLEPVDAEGNWTFRESQPVLVGHGVAPVSSVPQSRIHLNRYNVPQCEFRGYKLCDMLFLLIGIIFILVLITIIRGIIRVESLKPELDEFGQNILM